MKKKKEMSKNEIAEMNKILEHIKYENAHPNEEVKNEEKEEIAVQYFFALHLSKRFYFLQIWSI